jgi:hypothetical protein
MIKETGDDLMVLGMPWLQRINPEIDSQKRTVTLRKEASKETRGKIGDNEFKEPKNNNGKNQPGNN